MYTVELNASSCERGEIPDNYFDTEATIDFWELKVIPLITPESKRRYEYRQEHKDE